VNDLELAASLAYKSARHVLESGMPSDVDIISINVPENADSTSKTYSHPFRKSLRHI